MLKELYCKLFGHSFIVKKEVTPFVKEYQCRRCGKQFTTSLDGSIVPLTLKRKEINEELERLHKIRSKKRKQNPFCI